MTEHATSFLNLIAPVIGLVGVFATFILEHPRGYQSDIPEVKQNRLDDVCNALGPILSDSYDFVSESEDRAHEDLHEDERATIAVRKSITPVDDIPPLEESIDDFREPETAFKHCRLSYFASYILFLIAILAGAVPVVMEYTAGKIAYESAVSGVATATSLIAVVAGVITIFYFIYTNSRLDSMVESATFSLD